MAQDAELFHTGLQGCPLQPQAGGGTVWPAHQPVGFAQYSQDMFALDRFK